MSWATVFVIVAAIVLAIALIWAVALYLESRNKKAVDARLQRNAAEAGKIREDFRRRAEAFYDDTLQHLPKGGLTVDQKTVVDAAYRYLCRVAGGEQPIEFKTQSDLFTWLNGPDKQDC